MSERTARAEALLGTLSRAARDARRGPHEPRVLHVAGELIPPSETFVQQRLVPGAFAARALAWKSVPGGLEVPCPFEILPERAAPAAGAEGERSASGLRSRADSLARSSLRQLDLLRAISAAAPDVVHAHFGTVGLAVARACRLLGLPLVVSFYGFDVGMVAPGGATHRGYQEMFTRAAALTAEGPVLAARLASLGAPPARVKLLPLSLPPWAVAEPRPEVDVYAGPLRLLQVARFVEKKGIDTTLRALARARAAGADARLTLVGDGPLRDEVDALVRDLGLAAAVDRPGMVPHARLSEYCARHHVLIQPSRTARNGDTEGGHPTVLIEAQAQGLAVLATTHGDIPTAVRHGRTGLLCAEGDAEALAANIAGLARDRGRLAALRTAARPWVLRRHDPAVLLALRERIYRRAVAGARRPA